MPLWELLVGGVPVAFFVGSLIYVLVTYAAAYRHAPRPFGELVRSALHELVWTLAGQPLVPLYLFMGRRMSRRRSRTTDGPHRPPVVFVHGYTQSRANFLRIARELTRRGFEDLYGFNYPSLRSVRVNAERLARFVEKVTTECKADRIDLVCHSMGGLVALDYLFTEEGARRVARCVAIASPYGGVSWKGPIPGAAGADLRRGFVLPEKHEEDFGPRLLSIYSTHDNVVNPARTSSLAAFGGRDVEVGSMGHFAILFDPKVAKAVGDFLVADEQKAVARLPEGTDATITEAPPSTALAAASDSPVDASGDPAQPSPRVMSSATSRSSGSPTETPE